MTSTWHSKQQELPSITFCKAAAEGQYQGIHLNIFEKLCFKLMCIFGNTARAKGILLPVSASLTSHISLGFKINIQLSVTTQWSQPTNQKQDASISCNLQDKYKVKHDGIKSTQNWCSLTCCEEVLFQNIYLIVQFRLREMLWDKKNSLKQCKSVYKMSPKTLQSRWKLTGWTVRWYPWWHDYIYNWEKWVKAKTQVHC